MPSRCKVREVAQAALKLDSPDTVQTLVRQRVSATNVGNIYAKKAIATYASNLHP